MKSAARSSYKIGGPFIGDTANIEEKERGGTWKGSAIFLKLLEGTTRISCAMQQSVPTAGATNNIKIT